MDDDPARSHPSPQTQSLQTHVHVYGLGRPCNDEERPKRSGNTNGGKSLFMSLLNLAFETLCGVLPVTALTGRQTDPSSQNDYLARTHGMSFCVCHEPDSTTQQIYPHHASAG